MLIEIGRVTGERATVEAQVFGEWGAHPGIDRDGLATRTDWWVVTHLPTGRALSRSVGCLSDVEAVNLARALGERCPRGLVPPLPWAGSAELPADVRKILRSIIFDARGFVSDDDGEEAPW